MSGGGELLFWNQLSFFVTEIFLTLKVLSFNDQMLFILTRQCFRSSSGSCFGLARVQIWFLWRLFGLALNSNQIFFSATHQLFEDMNTEWNNNNHVSFWCPCSLEVTFIWPHTSLWMSYFIIKLIVGCIFCNFFLSLE